MVSLLRADVYGDASYGIIYSCIGYNMLVNVVNVDLYFCVCTVYEVDVYSEDNEVATLSREFLRLSAYADCYYVFPGYIELVVIIPHLSVSQILETMQILYIWD